MAQQCRRLWRTGRRRCWKTSRYELSIPTFSLLTTIGFIVQTPNDNGPFCSISVATLKHGTGGVWIADKNININFLLQNQRYDFNSHIGYDFILLPIRLLEWHVSYIGRQLTELQKKMAKVEQDIASGRRPTNYTELSSALNVCSSLQLTLDRRWMFEKALAHNLLKYFKAIEPDPVTHHSHFSSHLPPQVTTYPYPPSSIQRVKFHLQLSSGYEYDINILPQRIKLQQDAVRGSLTFYRLQKPDLTSHA